MNIVILDANALTTAQRIKTLYPQTVIHGLHDHTDGTEHHYDEFGEHLRTLYRESQPLLTLCTADIVIHNLAALLAEKDAEPPMLTMAEDGSAVVPLLGDLAEINRLAREIATHLNMAPTIYVCRVRTIAIYAARPIPRSARSSSCTGFRTIRSHRRSR